MSRDEAMGMGGKSRGDTSSSNNGGNGDNTREQYAAARTQTPRTQEVDKSFGGPTTIEAPYVMVEGEKYTIDSPKAKEAVNTIEKQNLLQKTIDLYQQYSPLGLISSLFANAPDWKDPPATRGGENEFRTQMNQLTPFAPYAISNQTPIESPALNWYKNLGQNTQTAFNFSQGYATAKARQQGILGTPTPIRYHAVSESPFFSFLKDNSLNKGIL